MRVKVRFFQKGWFVGNARSGLGTRVDAYLAGAFAALVVGQGMNTTARFSKDILRAPREIRCWPRLVSEKSLSYPRMNALKNMQFCC